MLKLMKYEFRKQAFSKGVILGLVGLTELYFAISVLLGKQNHTTASMSILAVLTVAILFFVAYEAIITFSKDLKEKCSYMLFLTPHSSYAIVGAKVLSAGLQVLLVGIVLFAIIAGDLTIIFAKYSDIARIKDIIQEVMKEFLSLDVNGLDIFYVVVNTLFNWISVITLAFFSISLSATFLANKKYKGIVSFVIFIAINVLFTYIVKWTIGDGSNFTQSYLLLSTLYNICFTVLTYVGTGYILDKKVSV